jgi:hypothetical protein
MSGRPVPRGLRVLTPHGTVFYVDAAVGELGTVRPRAAQPTPSSWFVDRMAGSSTKTWDHEELGSEWIFCRASAVALRRRPLGRARRAG